MDPHRTWRKLFLLLLLAYLGFYVYGLILGVFSPFELLALTIVAIAMVVTIVLIWLRWRLGGPDEDGSDEDARKLHGYRERRGF